MRAGLKKEWEDAEEQRNASPTASANFKGSKKWRTLLWTVNVKALWYKICYVTYGSEDIKAAFDKLQGHRHDLYSLSSGLPFNFSERLRGLEDNLMVVWAPGVKTPKPMVRTSSSIHDLKSEPLRHSYDTRFGMENGETGRLIVIRNSNMIAHREPCLESDDPAKREQANLEWIVKMLGSIREDKQCVKVGLMQCEGYFVPYSSRNERALSFKYPIWCGSRIPRTLRDTLVSMPTPSLTDRVRISQTLVASVVVLHTLGIVHRFLNPESVIIFEHEDGPQRVGDLYLLGFSQSREEKARSGNMTADDDKFRAEVYLHFDILASPRRLKYTMKHDIFSLGVCLLEIALWRSIFTERASSPDSDSKELLIFDKEGPYSFLGSIEIGDELRQEQSERFHPAKDKTPTDPSQERIAHRRRERLVAYAKKEIPPLMGQTFCDVVVACLEIDLQQVSPAICPTPPTNPVLSEGPIEISRAGGEGCRDSKSKFYPKHQVATGTAACDSGRTSPTSTLHDETSEYGSADGVKRCPGGLESLDSTNSSTTVIDTPTPSPIDAKTAESKAATPNSGRSRPPSSAGSRCSSNTSHSPSYTDEKAVEKSRETKEEKKAPELIRRQRSSLDIFLDELLLKQRMSGDAVHTIIVARNILQRLERINI